MEPAATRARRVPPRHRAAPPVFNDRELRRLVERASDVVFRYRVQPERGFDYVSRGITRVTGYTPQDLYADPESIIKLVHRDDRGIVDDALERGGGRLPIVLRWLRKDGSVVWIEQRDVAAFNRAGELLAIEAFCREILDPGLGSRASVRILGDMRIDLDRGRVLVGGAPVRLTPSEFRLLVLLTDRPGRVVSRTTIMQALWESQHVGSGRTCEVHISKLRGKLETDPRQPSRIETIRGEGYRFIPSG